MIGTLAAVAGLLTVTTSLYQTYHQERHLRINFMSLSFQDFCWSTVSCEDIEQIAQLLLR